MIMPMADAVDALPCPYCLATAGEPHVGQCLVGDLEAALLEPDDLNDTEDWSWEP